MHVVILEDEAIVAQRLARLTRTIVGEALTAIHCVAELAEAARYLGDQPDAVLLLDLNLAGRDGFEILRRALVEPFQTIVVSANTARAIEAFELGVVDFVAKPFSRERLATAFERVRKGMRQERTRFLAVSVAGQIDLIPVESVLAIHGDGDYSSIERLDARRHLHKKTLTALECVLPPRFQRVHRSHIVNMNHVTRIVVHEGGSRSLVLANGTRVPVGRSYVKALQTDLIR
jgi:DNA-binding LytR/AlgR family response regulator